MANIACLDFTNFFNVIDGNLVTTAETRHSLNPSTLEANPEVPLSTSRDVDKAVMAAKKAAPNWASIPFAQRQQVLRSFSDGIQAHAKDFAEMIVREQGRPESLSGSFHGTTVPVYLAMFKIASALLTGNAFILKPSPFTPYCGLKLAELGQKYFPPGIFQALSGDDALGPLLTSHLGVDKVSFTGSVAIGKKVMEACSQSLKRFTLELGGNDAAIVCDDVDIAAVASKIMNLALFNTGQMCIAIKRVYVHSSIFDSFFAAVSNVLQHLKLGDGFEEKILIGPIQNSLQYQRVKDIVDHSKLQGLDHVELSQSQVPQRGYFIAPIIFKNPPESSRIVVEEPFGPALPLLQWTDEEDVIRRVNASDVGLGASVWTTDTSGAERIARRLEAGTVWVNTHAVLDPHIPFGGHKNSGIGTELGIEGLKGYCNIQTLHLGVALKAT